MQLPGLLFSLGFLLYFPFILSQVNLDRSPHRLIYDTESTIYLSGQGLEMEARFIKLKLGTANSEYIEGVDYMIENFSSREGLKIKLISRWADFSIDPLPASIVLSSVKYEGFDLNLLPYPKVIATVFPTPVIHSNEIKIFPGPSQVLQISGKYLKGHSYVQLILDNSMSYRQDRYTDLSDYPLKNDTITITNIQFFSSKTVTVYGVNTAAGTVFFNDRKGVVVARLMKP